MGKCANKRPDIPPPPPTCLFRNLHTRTTGPQNAVIWLSGYSMMGCITGREAPDKAPRSGKSDTVYVEGLLHEFKD